MFRYSYAAGLLLLAGVLGCAVGPNYQAPTVEAPTAFLNAPAGTIATNELPRTWWRTFKDPLLEKLIALAVARNHNVRVAEARLREARAAWRESRFDFAPTITSENRYVKSQLSKDAVSSGQQRANELYRIGLDATWELDLWGRVRRSVEAARATVEAVEASRDDVQVRIEAEVAANYVELRGLQMQEDVASRNATNQAQILRLSEALLSGGSGTRFDVARARSLLNETLASIPPIQGAAQQTIHRIAVLCGQSPTSLQEELLSPAPLPEGPEHLVLSDPASLLRRRPDVRAAERSLAASTARIGVEVGDLFPKVTFVGSVGLQARSVSALTESGADAYGFGPHISWAAFDLGRVRQRIAAAGAQRDGALAIYEQTVLLALEEAENSLVTFGRERQRLEFLGEAERAAAEATELARQRYRDGITDFLSVLDAERTLLSLQEQLSIGRTRAAVALIAVYKAFAGPLQPGDTGNEESVAAVDGVTDGTTN